jgi:hypothetical protein
LIGFNAEKLTRVTFMLFAGKAKRDCGAGLHARRSGKKKWGIPFRFAGFYLARQP